MPRIRTHPGEILRAEYLEPLGLSARALAEELGVPGNRVSELLRGRRDVTADTAIRLGRRFGTEALFWLNLQSAYDLSKAQAETDYRNVKQHRPARIMQAKSAAVARFGVARDAGPPQDRGARARKPRTGS